ncbi:MAG: DUF2878 domain-containing protein [Planctomycetota bacterium]
MAFKVVYAACVFGAAQGNTWIGPLTGLVVLPVNLLFAPDRRAELRIWLLAGVLGSAVDSGLLAAGLIDFPPHARLVPEGSFAAGAVVPLWIATLWVAFGSLVRTSLGWMRRRAWIPVAFGLVGGPFSFWTGSRVGATELPEGWVSLAVLGLEYAVLLPILLAAARPVATVSPTAYGGRGTDDAAAAEKSPTASASTASP